MQYVCCFANGYQPCNKVTCTAWMQVYLIAESLQNQRMDIALVKKLYSVLADVQRNKSTIPVTAHRNIRLSSCVASPAAASQPTPVHTTTNAATAALPAPAALSAPLCGACTAPLYHGTPHDPSKQPATAAEPTQAPHADYRLEHDASTPNSTRVAPPSPTPGIGPTACAACPVP